MAVTDMRDTPSIDFVILGAQKAATSALQGALRAAPEIAMPAGESAFFEDPDFGRAPWLGFAQAHRGAQLRGIKRPDYLCSDEAIARISAVLPQARFIAVLREPVSRAVSSYLYLVRHGHLPVHGLDEGILRSIEAWRAGRGDRAASVISYGLYGQYIARWFEHYPRERFLFLPQTLVSKDPQAALAACRRHLGLAQEGQSLAAQPIERANEGLYDIGLLPYARLASLVKTRPIAGTYRREPRVLPVRALGAVMSRAVEGLARWRGQERPRLSAQTEAVLREIYARDCETLRGLVAPEVIYWESARA